MRRALVIVVLAVWVGTSAATAAAHHRHYGHYDDYGCYDYGYDSAVVIYDLGRAGDSRRYVAQSERLLGQQIAAMQMAVMQGNIRGTMEADGQQRMQSILGQQQADRDWWLQTQQQQISQRQAQAAQLALLKAAADINPATPAVPGLIQWPPALRGRQFAEQRARIEAPYRRGGKVPSTPTAKDYQDMIAAAGQMKTLLKGMAANVSAQGYLDATEFLDQLAAEARGRIDDAPSKKR
jgi:hypothetical protein